MKVIRATKKDKLKAMQIASTLNEWFTEEGLKNMQTDFELNNVIVAKENDIVLGFLCYTSNCGKMLLLWIGVSAEKQRKGIGKEMLDKLVREGKKRKLYSIEVETLPDEDEYGPYKITRAFYYKNGFEKILYKKARIKGWDDQIVLEKIIS